MALLPDILTPIRSSTSETRSDRVLEVTFGNGYIQRAANGINSLQREVSITYIVSPTDIQTYIDFFDNLKGYKNFQWKHPKDLVTKNWVVGDRSISDLGESVRQLSTTFILDYSSAT